MTRRLGVFADVHANLAALEAILDFLEMQGANELICLGDLVGYGPQPNEVVARIAELRIPTVHGNHDLVAIGTEALDRCGSGSRASLEWTRNESSDDTLSYLRSLPASIRTDEIVAAHGSIDDPWTYVRRAPDAYEQLARMERESAGRLLLLGHTHRQMAIDASSGKMLSSDWIRARRTRRIEAPGLAFLNPGAVGQSREPRPVARCALVDLDTRVMHLYALRYPHERCEDALISRGLPATWCHPKPTLKKTLRQALRDREDRRYRPTGRIEPA